MKVKVGYLSFANSSNTQIMCRFREFLNPKLSYSLSVPTFCHKEVIRFMAKLQLPKSQQAGVSSGSFQVFTLANVPLTRRV